MAHRDALVTLLPLPDMRELHADFDTFRLSAVALVSGGDIYDTPAKLTNLNPPLLTVLLAPTALLDALTGYRIFAALTLLLVVGAIVAVTRELRLSWRGEHGRGARRARVVSAARHARARPDLRPAAGRAHGGMDRRAPGAAAAGGGVLRRHCGAQAVAGPAAAAPARDPALARRRRRPGGGGGRVAARGAHRRPRHRAGVATDRADGAGSGHRRQRVAARPGRAVRPSLGPRYGARPGCPRRARWWRWAAGATGSTPPAPPRGRFSLRGCCSPRSPGTTTPCCCGPACCCCSPATASRTGTAPGTCPAVRRCCSP